MYPPDTNQPASAQDEPAPTEGVAVAEEAVVDAEAGVGDHADGPQVEVMAADTATVEVIAEESPRPSPVQSFQAELAKAMQSAARRERDRITRSVTEEASAQVEKVKARAATETDELRRLADDDIKGIADWSAMEIERIRSEALQRTEERRASLEEHIVRHGGIIEREIASVDTAVVGYHATLETYFQRLSSSTDPVEIARMAGDLPTLPDLQDVRATARSAAVAEAARDAEAVAYDPADDEPGPPAGGVGPAPMTDGSGVEVPAEASGQADSGQPDSGQPDAAPPDAGPADQGVGTSDPGPDATSGSAAVRLLRTIAPWTSPGDRPEDARTDAS
jgi:hypothetical protein